MSFWQLLLGVSIGVAVLFWLIRRGEELHPTVKEPRVEKMSWLPLLIGASIVLFILNRGFRERLVEWLCNRLGIKRQVEEPAEDGTIKARQTKAPPKQEPRQEAPYQPPQDLHGRVEATDEDVKKWTENPEVKVVG